MGQLLTIAIPTYNREQLLKRTMESVLKQIDNRVELLVSDNASTDGTAALVKSYMVTYPQISYYCNEKNLGADGNFLKCIKKAVGEYVLLLGSDDILIDGAINRICDYLDNHQDTSLLFLNHTFFKEKYVDIAHCYSKFLQITEDVTTTDKKVFMQYVQQQLTFMSVSIVRRLNVMGVKNPEQFFETSFIHSCLCLASTKEQDAVLGILALPCIAQDMTPGNSNINNFWYVFGNRMYHTLCEVSVEYGYNERQMKQIFYDYVCRVWPKVIGTQKVQRTFKTKDFIKDAYPTIKKSLRAKMLIISSLLMPAFAWRGVQSVYMKLKG